MTDNEVLEVPVVEEFDVPEEPEIVDETEQEQEAAPVVEEKTKPKHSRKCGPRCIGRRVDKISYKHVDLLERYITRQGRIRPRRQTGTCAKHQRAVARAIKRARYMALLPFTSEHFFTSPRKAR